MSRARSRWSVAVAVALGVALACAVAYAHPLHVPSWSELLGQTTGGSFGGSSWGSGGGGSSSAGGGSSSGSSGSSGDGIADVIVSFVLQLLLELLWHAFLWGLSRYPAATIAVLVIVALFAWRLWLTREDAPALAPPTPEGAAPRAAEFGREDEAVIGDLAGTMSMVGRGGAALSAVLALAGAVTCALHTRQVGAFFAGLAELAAGAATAVASWRVLRAAEAFQKVVDTTGTDLDHVAAAAAQLHQLFAWVGRVLAVVMAALVVLVIAGFSLGS